MLLQAFKLAAALPLLVGAAPRGEKLASCVGGECAASDGAALLQHRRPREPATPAPREVQPESGLEVHHRGNASTAGALPFRPRKTRHYGPLICEGAGFFDCFDFYLGEDPTHGFVEYVPRWQAEQQHLVGSTERGTVYMASTTGAGHGRRIKSVRLHAKRTYQFGLFILDVVHVPTGDGVWPAWWMYGPDWPNTGEFDMWETVNNEQVAKSSIHTRLGCRMAGVADIDNGGAGGSGPSWNPGQDGAGVWGLPAGDVLNRQGGAHFAVRWSEAGFDMYYFPRGQAPSDIGSELPDVATWGEPWRRYPFGPECDPNHFTDMMPTFDLTFCGDWAGNVAPWNGNPAACNAHVSSTGNAEAYWEINSMRVFPVD